MRRAIARMILLLGLHLGLPSSVAAQPGCKCPPGTRCCDCFLCGDGVFCCGGCSDNC
jgi:hypothetical protein